MSDDPVIEYLTERALSYPDETDADRLCAALEVLAPHLYARPREIATGLDAPDEPGHVAFEVEVVPHDWANDGMGWHKGRDTPARVAQILRDYADQVEHFTPPKWTPHELTKEEQARLFAEKFASERTDHPDPVPGCNATWTGAWEDHCVKDFGHVEDEHIDATGRRWEDE